MEVACHVGDVVGIWLGAEIGVDWVRQANATKQPGLRHGPTANVSELPAAPKLAYLSLRSLPCTD